MMFPFVIVIGTDLIVTGLGIVVCLLGGTVLYMGYKIQRLSRQVHTLWMLSFSLLIESEERHEHESEKND